MITRILSIILLISFGCSNINSKSNQTKDSVKTYIQDTSKDNSFAKPQSENPVSTFILPLSEIDTIPVSDKLPVPLIINNKLFLYDSESKSQQETKHLGIDLEELYASPNRKYAVYTTVVGYEDPPQKYIEGVEQPKEPIRNLVIIRISTQSILRHISVPDNRHICFDNWISASRLTYYVWDDNRYEQCFVYDAFRDSVQVAPYRHWHD
jgi:hypothetical protein